MNINQRCKVAIATVLIVALGGCSSPAKKSASIIGPTLTKLDPADIPAETVEIPKVDLNEIENYYKRALVITRDDAIRRDILIRLAGLEMIRSEENLVNAQQDGKFFEKAAGLYKELIALQRKSQLKGRDGVVADKKIDELLYQLSKAYALDGSLGEADQSLQDLAKEYPTSGYAAEALFRRAEKAFSEGRYSESQSLYESVVKQGTATPFYQNSLYMFGWSQFKRGRYEDSLTPFTTVLDNLFGDQAELDQLSKPQRNLAEDTLRVMSLVFAYLDGPVTITDVYTRMGKRPYNHQLFVALGELYLEKKRFRDSADTYRYFITDSPLSDYAPAFSVRAIGVYQKGNFPSLLIPAKEEYVNNYGINSDYWAQKPESVRDNLLPHLHEYLQELAKYEHAEAQKLTALLKQPKKAKNIADPGPVYLKAARWYQQFVQTFPEDKQTATMHFLMAEAFNDAGEIELAYNAYYKVAYGYPATEAMPNPNGADAAYAAILLTQELANVSTTDAAQSSTWLNAKIDNAKQFADTYPQDKRAVIVLTEASQALLAQNRQPEAILAATKIVQWQPEPALELRRSAWLVLAQSEFDLQSFASAENAYNQVLTLMPTNDPQRASIIERRAASAYKGAEQLLAEDKKQQAIEQLLRVQQLAPDTDIAITAQYDAGNYLIELEQWAQARQVLEGFRQRYPNHRLTKTLPAKLVVVYQSLELWQPAANELTLMTRLSDDPDVRRQSLLLAAGLYEKSGDSALAIERYRRYANTYPAPFDEAMEARFKLVGLYEQQNDTLKRQFWLQKMITAHRQGGANQTPRSAYLAAYASNQFARQQYQKFKSIRLSLPLKTSLKRKQTALKRTLADYQQVLDYGVAEFTTEASFYIGDIYAQLSRDLMSSDRPKGLDALALEQYDILLEEQAFPFEEKAIDIHRTNAQRSWSGLYDEWVKASFLSLKKLMPGRYNKVEQHSGVSRGIY